MKFSIIIPAYNVSQYISDCCLSVLEQDFDSAEFEVIVVDDCSPDNLGQKVTELQAEYSNLVYLRHDRNKRQGGARNTGLGVASGKYIMFLDGDDCWRYNNVLTVIEDIMDGERLDMFQSTTFENVNNSYKLSAITAPPLSELAIYTREEYLSLRQFSYSVCFSCFRKDIIDKWNLRFRENVVFEDSDWPIRYYYCCDRIGKANFSFYTYRNNPDSTLHKPRVQTFKDNTAGIMAIYEFFVSGNFNVSDECRQICYNRLKDSILSYIMISRDYKISESLEALRRLRIHPVMSLDIYEMNLLQKARFALLKYYPILEILPIRIITLSKRLILKWLRR